MSLWIFYDDIIEEDDDRLGDSIRRAIGGRLKHVRIDNPHLRCWAELGRRYSEVMSRTWLDRHARRFISWVYSVREESEAAKQFRDTGFYPPAAKHLDRRRMNIGMIPNIDFIEYQMGWELPTRFLKDSNFKKLERLSAEVVAIINDLFGYTKDQNNRWSNLVSCVAQEFEISTEEAFRCVGVMHNHRIYQMVNCEAKLLEKFPNQPMLKRWLDGLHHIVYGFARWHAMAPRYSHRHPVEKDKRDVRITIREKINPSQKISNRLAS